jgi:acyl-CoA reductase-like NAD-dependent aldehyde dehydrogenase
MFDSRIADTFAERLAGMARQLSLGVRCKAPVVLDSVVDLNIVARCNSLTDDALAKGARLSWGVHVDSSLMPATLLGKSRLT